jgi:hypothetical protein
MLNPELLAQATRRFADDLHVLDDGEQELPICLQIIARASLREADSLTRGIAHVEEANAFFRPHTTRMRR